ncbi:MAG: GGDEF domain-containing protein, partial [Pirellulales bacterium]
LMFGGAAGWWLGRSQGSRGQRPAGNPTESAPPIAAVPQPAANAEGGLDRAEAQAMLAKMQELAAGMASNVTQHHASVQAASSELNTAPDGTQLPPTMAQAVASILAANERLKSELAAASHKIQDQSQQIAARMAESRTDVLTGLANRRAFDDEIAKRLAEWHEQQIPTALVLLDVDHFKKFNDKHGHLAGDEVLRGVGRMLKQTVGKAGLAARYGGEEFAAILPNATRAQANELAEAIRQAIESHRCMFEGAELRVTASSGMARPTTDEAAADWIRRADEALYASKKAGRNCVSEHNGRECRRLSPMVEEAAASAPPSRGAKPRSAVPAALHDPMTGMHSRESLTEQLATRLAEWRRSATPVSIALIAVDDFADIQQQHGEATTNMVLAAATQFLKAALRETDMIARHADDSFGILLPASGLPKARQVAERIRAAIDRCDALRSAAGKPLRFSVSVGITESQIGDDAHQMLARAAEHLQAAVKAGGNATCGNAQPQAESRKEQAVNS